MIFNQLVEDIRGESCLWSLKSRHKPEHQEDAWRRVAGKNKMTSVEVKLIFRELSKKYKEERKKPKSSWKLMEALSFLDEDLRTDLNRTKPAVDPGSQSPNHDNTTTDPPQIKDEPNDPAAQGLQNTSNASEDDIYVELLEVNDEGDFSDDEMSSPLSSSKESESTTSPASSVKRIFPNPLKTISVRNQSIINSSIANPNSKSSLITTTSPSLIRPSITASNSLLKTPTIFAGLKRKLANGSDPKNTTPENNPPMEKQSKTTQENTEKQYSTISKSPIACQQKDLTHSQTTLNKTSPDKSMDKPIAGSISDIEKENSNETVRTEICSVNIGDVIPMTDVQTIKVEAPDDESIIDKATIQICTDINSQLSKSFENASNKLIPSNPQCRMYDSFGQYVSNTLNTLPSKLANKLEIKILEAIIAINTEKSNDA